MQTKQVIALVIVVSIMTLALGATIGYSISSGRTSTRTETQTETTFQTSLLSTTITTTTALTNAHNATQLETTTISSISQSLVIPCTNVYPNGTAPPDAPSLYVQENGSAYLCVRYYFYNSTSTMNVNASSIISFEGINNNGSVPVGFNPASNFTVATIPSELTIGGSHNLNEGALVVYDIHANSNSNGTYTFSLLATLYPSMEDCAGFAEIIVGNGLPDYHEFGSCTAPLTGFYPLNTEGFINGFLIAQVVGISNLNS
jgi:hypothetical protein